MRTRRWIYAAMFASVFAISACDDDDDNERSLNAVDDNFVEKAALANMTEVDFGQLASTKATNTAVKAFAQHMVSEHTTAQNELRDIADDYNNIDWPDDLDQQHQQIKQQLMTLTGYAFDSLYMASQVMDHETTRNLFQNEITNGTEQRVKSYASKYLPGIEHHLHQADSIRNVLLTSGDGN
jgi:putative membrane protein